MAEAVTTPARLAVIGAGPIGVELALDAVQRGLDVEVFERAESCAGHVKSWEFVKLFSPWSLNMTDIGRNALRDLGKPVPDDSVFPTGGELRDAYLLPLLEVLRSNTQCRGVHFGAEVISIGRGALLKGESIGGGSTKMPKGKPLVPRERRETSFRLLVREGEAERYVEGFDFVIDCSGSYGNGDLANNVGMGGLSAVGERSLRSKKRLWATIPNVLGGDSASFAKKRTLVVGAGMSAATVLRDLNQLAEAEEGTNILWMTRSGSDPFTVIADDVLPQRKALCEMGNKAARGEIKDIGYIGGAAVTAIEEKENGRLSVTIQCHNAEPLVEEVDQLVGCCGYRPDSSLYEELQVHQCYASNGPMKLAATLIGASGDCLAQVGAGVDSLKNPEPGFFILGSKSYGRNSAFLLKIGHEQVRTVLDSIAPTSQPPAAL